MWFYAFPIFLSALLLFQVQPIIAKHILPWFGGTPAVWTTCMVFFQVALLGGYAYAHLSIRLLTPRKQAVLHGLLLAGCIVLLPAIPAETWKPIGGESEIPRILALLAVTIGGPYLILAANGPLLQAWFSREFPKASPYRLYALSNVGSLLALLSYPVLLEPGLSLRWQEYSWSGLFVLFAAACGICAWRAFHAGVAGAGEITGKMPVGLTGRMPVLRETPMPRTEAPATVVAGAGMGETTGKSLGPLTGMPVGLTGRMPVLRETPIPRLQARSAVEPPAPVAAEAIQAPVPPAQPARLLPWFLAARVEPGPAIRPGLVRGALTLLLPACACVVLLATTNQMTQDLPVVPFLWIIPLALYLLTFIICFDRDWWYFRPLWIGLMGLGLWGIYEAVQAGVDMPVLKQIVLYSAGLFTCCMVCHGELARLRPAPNRLTGYYLLISAGGALGGLFVALAAPKLFSGPWSGFWEFQGALIACGTLLAVVIMLDRRFIRFLQWTGPVWLRAGFASACLSLLICLSVYFVRQARADTGSTVEVSRNFYGILRVEKSPYFEGDGDGDKINLMHGRITHGTQYTSDNYRTKPVSYYGPTSGIGVADAALRQRGGHVERMPSLMNKPGDGATASPATTDPTTTAPATMHASGAPANAGANLRIGAVGLGAGVVAAYGQRGDFIRFYEINADMLRISDAHFTYRKDAHARHARTQVVLGDARLTMERAKERGESGQFDVIVLDAFSGDSIPLHLLTSQAVELYLYHLKPDGVLAFHISNRYLDLEGLVRGLADQAGKMSMLIESDDDDNDPRQDRSTWVLATGSAELLDAMKQFPSAAQWTKDGAKPIVFTDDYSNLFQLLDLGGE